MKISGFVSPTLCWESGDTKLLIILTDDLFLYTEKHHRLKHCVSECFFLLFYFILECTRVFCLHVCLYSTCMCLVPTEAKSGHGVPGTEVTEITQVLLPAEPSLSSPQNSLFKPFNS